MKNIKIISLAVLLFSLGCNTFKPKPDDVLEVVDYEFDPQQLRNDYTELKTSQRATTATNPYPSSRKWVPHLGGIKTLGVLIHYQDEQPSSFTYSGYWATAEEMRSFLFNRLYPNHVKSYGKASLSDFFLENSYGQQWFEGDVFEIKLPYQRTNTKTYSQITHDALVAASNSGLNLFSYELIILANVANGPAAGWATGSYMWLGSVTAPFHSKLFYYVHEIGHALGLSHAGGIVCYDPSGTSSNLYPACTVGTDCASNKCSTFTSSSTMYSNCITGCCLHWSPLDIWKYTSQDGYIHFGQFCTGYQFGGTHSPMGGDMLQYAGYEKEKLGWLNNRILTVESTGTYQLGAYQSSAEDFKVIKIPIPKEVTAPDGTNLGYSLEYKRLGFPARPYNTDFIYLEARTAPLLSEWDDYLITGGYGSANETQARKLGYNDPWGVNAYYKGFSGNNIFAIDSSPETRALRAIEVGETLYIKKLDLSISTLSASTSGALVEIKFNSGPPPTKQPTILPTNTPTQTITTKPTLTPTRTRKGR